MIKIAKDELTFTFSTSSGAGGQNVNKVNTKATMSWDMKNSSSCSSFVKERFTKKYSRLVFEGMVVIESQKFRSQKRNIDDCIAKLHECLKSVELPPKKRKATKPSKSSVKKRLDKKSKDSLKKKLRGEKLH